MCCASATSSCASLGAGGMGIVYLAADTRLDHREVAVKLLPAVLARNARAIAKLKKEAATCLDLTHPNIVRLHNFEVDPQHGDAAFLVMQYVQGQTLDDLLAEALEGLPPAARRWLGAADRGGAGLRACPGRPASRHQALEHHHRHAGPGLPHGLWHRPGSPRHDDPRDRPGLIRHAALYEPATTAGGEPQGQRHLLLRGDAVRSPDRFAAVHDGRHPRADSPQAGHAHQGRPPARQRGAAGSPGQGRGSAPKVGDGVGPAPGRPPRRPHPHNPHNPHMSLRLLRGASKRHPHRRRDDRPSPSLHPGRPRRAPRS